jgi:hypothetical protein
MTRQQRYELTASDGTPSERIAKRAKLYSQPMVSTLDRAVELLGIPEGELARRVTAAGLEPFALHASGAPLPVEAAHRVGGRAAIMTWPVGPRAVAGDGLAARGGRQRASTVTRPRGLLSAPGQPFAASRPGPVA